MSQSSHMNEIFTIKGYSRADPLHESLYDDLRPSRYKESSSRSGSGQYDAYLSESWNSYSKSATLMSNGGSRSASNASAMKPSATKKKKKTKKKSSMKKTSDFGFHASSAVVPSSTWSYHTKNSMYAPDEPVRAYRPAISKASQNTKPKQSSKMKFGMYMAKKAPRPKSAASALAVAQAYGSRLHKPKKQPIRLKVKTPLDSGLRKPGSANSSRRHVVEHSDDAYYMRVGGNASQRQVTEPAEELLVYSQHQRVPTSRSGWSAINDSSRVTVDVVASKPVQKKTSTKKSIYRQRAARAQSAGPGARRKVVQTTAAGNNYSLDLRKAVQVQQHAQPLSKRKQVGLSQTGRQPGERMQKSANRVKSARSPAVNKQAELAKRSSYRNASSSSSSGKKAQRPRTAGVASKKSSTLPHRRPSSDFQSLFAQNEDLLAVFGPSHFDRVYHSPQKPGSSRTHREQPEEPAHPVRPSFEHYESIEDQILAQCAVTSIESPERPRHAARNAQQGHAALGMGFCRLPEEMISTVLSYLDFKSMVSLTAMNRSWRRLAATGEIVTQLDLSPHKKVVKGKHLLGLASSHNLRGVEIVDLSQCNNLTAQDVVRFLSSFPKLEALRMARLGCVSDAVLHYVSLQNGALNRLDLSYSDSFTEMGFAEIAQRCKALRHVNLTRCRKLTDDMLKALGENCTGLQSLNLTWCSAVTDYGVAAIAVGCPKLQTLVLRRCAQVSPGGIRGLVRGCPRLVTLVLDHCAEVDDVSMKCIAELSRLQTLSLTYCKKLTNDSIMLLGHGTCRQSLHELNTNYCGQISLDYGMIRDMYLPGLKEFSCLQCPHTGAERSRHMITEAECVV